MIAINNYDYRDLADQFIDMAEREPAHVTADIRITADGLDYVLNVMAEVWDNYIFDDEEEAFRKDEPYFRYRCSVVSWKETAFWKDSHVMAFYEEDVWRNISEGERISDFDSWRLEEFINGH